MSSSRERLASCSSSSSGGSDEELEICDGADNGLSVYACVFCGHVSSTSALELLESHVPAEHGVRLLDFAKERRLRQHDWVRLVRHLRRGAGQSPEVLLRDFVVNDEAADADVANGDSADDPLLYEIDVEELLTDVADVKEAVAAGREAQLEAEVLALRARVADMTALLRRLAADDAGDSSRGVGDLNDEEDAGYVDSYCAASIHVEMLQDEVRTTAYQRFVQSNPRLFEGRRVLDVGCGSGILSLFAAKAGARVTAVDCASILEEAVVAAAENGLADKIDFHRGKLERLRLPRDQLPVDIVLSEWMGYFLLFEGMLHSVLHARDACLRQGGLVLPQVCELMMCGLDCPELHDSHVGLWDNVWNSGIRLSYFKERCLTDALVMHSLRPEWVATGAGSLRRFDLLKTKAEDLTFVASLRLVAERACTLHALAGYFDAQFLAEPEPGDVNVSFSTGPLSRDTHWGQTVFFLRRPLQLAAGETVEFHVKVDSPPDSPRSLRVGIRYGGRDDAYLVE